MLASNTASHSQGRHVANIVFDGVIDMPPHMNAFQTYGRPRRKTV
jgi:hypothetical protein